MFGGSRSKAAAVAAGQAEAAVTGAGLGGGGHLLPAGTAPSANAAEVNQRIAAALKENPEEVKRLFRTWVQQQQGAA